jgi:hypothetical protein
LPEYEPVHILKGCLEMNGTEVGKANPYDLVRTHAALLGQHLGKILRPPAHIVNKWRLDAVCVGQAQGDMIITHPAPRTLFCMNFSGTPLYFFFGSQNPNGNNTNGPGAFAVVAAAGATTVNKTNFVVIPVDPSVREYCVSSNGNGLPGNLGNGAWAMLTDAEYDPFTGFMV